jgi:dipeptidyl aminopeptidase/acylaminoacyl peptidase
MRYLALLALPAALSLPIFAQQTYTREQIAEAVRDGGCITLRQARVCGADYSYADQNVEALMFRPATGATNAPAVLLIPGYQRTVFDFLQLGSRLAAEGFVSMAISQPGFGRAGGAPDYVGPATMRTVADAFERLKKLPETNDERLGVYGHSRGGMAASLLAVHREDLKAAVLAAGIYDFLLAFCEADPGIRDNMALETGMRDRAIRNRSSIHQMENLRAAVLILHGDKDANVSVKQAYALRDRLEALGKTYQAEIIPGMDHFFGKPEITETVVTFLRKYLMPPSPQ